MLPFCVAGGAAVSSTQALAALLMLLLRHKQRRMSLADLLPTPACLAKASNASRLESRSASKSCPQHTHPTPTTYPLFLGFNKSSVSWFRGSFARRTGPCSRGAAGGGVARNGLKGFTAAPPGGPRAPVGPAKGPIPYGTIAPMPPTTGPEYTRKTQQAQHTRQQGERHSSTAITARPRYSMTDTSRAIATGHQKVCCILAEQASSGRGKDRSSGLQAAGTTLGCCIKQASCHCMWSGSQAHGTPFGTCQHHNQ